MFLAIVAVLLVTLICGPILLVQRTAEHIRHQRTLTPADRAERSAEQWRNTGRRWGLMLFWTWCLMCGAVLAICLYGLAELP
jgi:ABC-type Fe3+ transport system permease subunit